MTSTRGNGRTGAFMPLLVTHDGRVTQENCRSTIPHAGPDGPAGVPDLIIAAGRVQTICVTFAGLERRNEARSVRCSIARA